MREILVIRHGETDYNVQRRLQGTMDTELNGNGLAQAVEAAELLADSGITAIYSSTLRRARRTAEIIADRVGVPIVFREGLREKSFGIMEGLSVSEIKDRYGDILADLRHFINHAAPEGESNQDVMRRLEPVLQEVMEAHPHGRVLLVTHGAVARILYRMLARPADHLYETFQMDNCEILKFSQLEEGGFACGNWADTEKTG